LYTTGDAHVNGDILHLSIFNSNSHFSDHAYSALLPPEVPNYLLVLLHTDLLIIPGRQALESLTEVPCRR